MTKVVWASVAANDFQDIVTFLSDEVPQAAVTFVDRIDDAVKKLQSHPQMGRVVPELQRQNITRYREVVVSPWRLFYRYEKETIYIISLIDGRRDVEEILLRRVLR